MNPSHSRSGAWRSALARPGFVTAVFFGGAVAFAGLALSRGNPVEAGIGALYAALFLLPLHRSPDALRIVRLAGMIGGMGLALFTGDINGPLSNLGVSLFATAFMGGRVAADLWRPAWLDRLWRGAIP